MSPAHVYKQPSVLKSFIHERVTINHAYTHKKKSLLKSKLFWEKYRKKIYEKQNSKTKIKNNYLILIGQIKTFISLSRVQIKGDFGDFA